MKLAATVFASRSLPGKYALFLSSLLDTIIALQVCFSLSFEALLFIVSDLCVNSPVDTFKLGLKT